MDQRYAQIINTLANYGSKGGLFSMADLAPVVALLSAAEQKTKAAHVG